MSQLRAKLNHFRLLSPEFSGTLDGVPAPFPTYEPVLVEPMAER